MAIEQNCFKMHHQVRVHFENFTEVKFRDILLTGTGHRDRRLSQDSRGQTGTYGRSILPLFHSTGLVRQELIHSSHPDPGFV